LQTGKFTFRVIEKGAARPHLTAEELKKRLTVPRNWSASIQAAMLQVIAPNESDQRSSQLDYFRE